MTILAVINNFDYDCKWVRKLPFPFEMLSNHSLKWGEATNCCYDIVNYLRYIIQNYDNLSDITWFFHGHEFAWHQGKKSILEYIQNIKYDRDYFNISPIRNDYFYGVNPKGFDGYDFHKNVINRIADRLNYFEPLRNLKKHKIITKFNAQFYVKKELILKHSKLFYQTLLDIIYEYRNLSAEHSMHCTYVFERLWGYIFTGKLIDDSNDKITTCRIV